MAYINLDTCMAGPILVPKASPIMKVNTLLAANLKTNIVLHLGLRQTQAFEAFPPIRNLRMFKSYYKLKEVKISSCH